MLILLNDKTGEISLFGLDVLDCVLIQSALIGMQHRGGGGSRQGKRKIAELIAICDPTVDIVLKVIASQIPEGPDEHEQIDNSQDRDL